MSKIYEIETNAYRALIEIDAENKVARCITESNANPDLCHADEVEDTSSWEEIDYAGALREIEESRILSEAGDDYNPGPDRGEEAAAALYDGGWRASDCFDMAAEYGMSFEEAIVMREWLCVYAERESAEAKYRIVYVGDEMNNRTGSGDYANHSFDREETARRTRADYDALSAYDRNNSTYAVEGYRVEVIPGESAKDAFNRMVEDCCWTPDPVTYEAIK